MEVFNLCISLVHQVDPHDDLVLSIYDAATDSDAWSQVPERITTAFGGIAMSFADGQSYDPTSFTENNFRHSDEFLLESGFVKSDNYDLDFNLGYRKALLGPIAKGHPSHTLLSQANERQRLYFEKCFLEFDTPYVQIFVTNRNQREISGGWMSYSEKFDPFQGQNAKRFDTVLSHLSRAVEIRSKLNIAKRTANTLGRQLDVLKTGVIIIDREWRVLYLNQSAEETVRVNAGIAVRTGTLRITDERAKQKFTDRLTSLLKTASDAIDSPIQLRGMLDQFVRHVWIYPAVGFALNSLPNTAFACIVIRDPFVEAEVVDQDVLINVFDLTPAEARVAQLTPLALSIDQLARQLGVSRNTVKTHLSNARSKLSVRSTAELAKMVARLQH